MSRESGDLERGLLSTSTTPTTDTTSRITSQRHASDGSNINHHSHHRRDSEASDDSLISPTPFPPEHVSDSRVAPLASWFHGQGPTPLTRRASSVTRAKIDTTLAITVRVKHLNYAVPDLAPPKSSSGRCGRLCGSQATKRVLKDVNLTFRPGKLSCLMGPSGSGKTSILSCILGNAAGIVESGEITVNGLVGPPAHFKSVAKLIPQEDTIMPSFTVRETLSFQAELVLPQKTTEAERKARVEAVIAALGLQDCADTRVGSVDAKGISGGERKRLSVGMEIICNPCVLCVDEPTSGLDSKSAEDVVNILRDVSRTAGNRTVVVTIHQPSWRIFQLFDEVTLMTKGRVAYHGPMAELEPFFNKIGFFVPNKENPADHIMRLLQTPEYVAFIPDAFASHQKSLLSSGVSSTDSDDGPLSADEILTEEEFARTVPPFPTTKTHQTWVLFRRQLTDSVKDPRKFARQLGVKVAVGVMVGTVWWQKANPPRQSEIFAVTGALFLLVFNGIIETLAMTILSFPLTRAILLREYKNGTYAVSSFYVAMCMSQAVQGAIAVLFMSVPVYFMVGFETSPIKLIIFASAMFVNILIGSALGISVGAASKDIMEAQNMLAPVLAPLMLFSGYLIPKDQIPEPFLPFYYISFFAYALKLFMVNGFDGMIFSDFSLNILHPAKIRPFRTGREYLKTIWHLDPEETPPEYFLGILAVYALFFIVVGFFVVSRAVLRKTN